MLDEKYFVTTAPTPHPSDSSQPSNCSCQIRSKISRNTTNLKDLDLKITLELVDFKKKLEDIRNLLGNAGSPPSESLQAGATNSSPEGNILLLIPPSTSSDSSSTPHASNKSETGSGYLPATIIKETEADPDSISITEEPSNTPEVSPTSDISIDETDDSEFDFSDVDLN